MPREWEHLETLGPVRLDAVTVRVWGEPESHGFTQAPDGAFFRPGWRAGIQRDKEGNAWTLAQADAEICAEYPAAWCWEWCKDERVTRVDLKQDVTCAPVWRELADYIAGHRGSIGWRQRRSGPKVEAGSRRSDFYLRIYLKCKGSGDETIPAYLAAEWAAWRWSGAPVTRVEFELKGKAVRGLRVEQLGGAVPRLWADALSRLRVTSRRVENYTEANKAPTCPGWRKLGDARRMNLPREPSPRPADWAERGLARMMREMSSNGVDVEKALSLAKMKPRRAEGPTRKEFAAARDSLWADGWDGVLDGEME